MSLFRLQNTIQEYVWGSKTDIPDLLGKPAGSDIGEGTFTLPVLLASEGPDGDRIKKLLANGQPYSPDDIVQVIDLTVQGGFIDVVLDEAVKRIEVAEEAARSIPDNPLTSILHNLDQYLLDRVTLARA